MLSQKKSQAPGEPGFGACRLRSCHGASADPRALGLSVSEWANANRDGPAPASHWHCQSPPAGAFPVANSDHLHGNLARTAGGGVETNMSYGSGTGGRKAFGMNAFTSGVNHGCTDIAACCCANQA
jgi:hypothetical protein